MRSLIEISKEAIINNINILCSITPNLFCVLKSNAYGHGLKELLNILKTQKINVICLSNIQEAEEAINYNWNKRLIVMAPYIENSSIEAINSNENIEFFIYSFDSLFKLISLKSFIKNKIKIHIKIDVGFNRLGFSTSDLEKLIEIINNNKNTIEVVGAIQHFSNTFSHDLKKTKTQHELFNKSCEIINKNFKNLQIHSFSSGAIDIANNEISRCGSMLYGIWKSDAQKKRFLEKFPEKKIKQILKWKAKILQIKNVKAGETVGYGEESVAQYDMKIAIISIGYSDGYFFMLLPEKIGYVYIKNQKANFFGRISMNIATINVTNISDISIDDEALIIDDKIEDINVNNVAKNFNVSGIQFTSCISKDIERILID
jgi:alanine racemase